jgi:hypothetical protein
VKWCTIARITKMRPDGSILGLKLLGVDQVDDDHVYGLRQQSEFEVSPVTGYGISVYHPELHMEGQRAYPGKPDGAPHPR